MIKLLQQRHRHTAQEPFSGGEQVHGHQGGLPWHYVLLGEDRVYEWQGKGARLADLLDFARLRPLADASLQARLI